jgi:hypothetical protein
MNIGGIRKGWHILGGHHEIRFVDMTLTKHLLHSTVSGLGFWKHACCNTLQSTDQYLQ